MSNRVYSRLKDIEASMEATCSTLKNELEMAEFSVKHVGRPEPNSDGFYFQVLCECSKEMEREGFDFPIFINVSLTTGYWTVYPGYKRDRKRKVALKYCEEIQDFLNERVEN